MDGIKQELIGSGCNGDAVSESFKNATSIKEAYDNAGVLLQATFNEDYATIYKTLGARLATIDKEKDQLIFKQTQSIGDLESKVTNLNEQLDETKALLKSALETIQTKDQSIFLQSQEIEDLNKRLKILQSAFKPLTLDK